MKQSDVISLVGVAVLGFIISYFVINTLIDPNQASITYKTVAPISSVVSDPDPDMFNVNAINPTQEVTIGDRCDLNGDGVLDDDEKEKCECDKDGNGELSNSEISVCKACDLDGDDFVDSTERAKCKNKCDLDGDGIVDSIEKARCNNECDLNGDGIVDDDEREECESTE